jgi:hypothetical protein
MCVITIAFSFIIIIIIIIIALVYVRWLNLDYLEAEGGAKKALSALPLHLTSGSEFPTVPASQRTHRVFYMNLIQLMVVRTVYGLLQELTESNKFVFLGKFKRYVTLH